MLSRPRVVVAVAISVGLAALTGLTGAPAQAVSTTTGAFSLAWHATTAGHFGTSAPVAVPGARGGTAVAAGDRNGKITMVTAATGRTVAGWNQHASGGNEIDAPLSSPSSGHVTAAITDSQKGRPGIVTWAANGAKVSWKGAYCDAGQNCARNSGVTYAAGTNIGYTGGPGQYVHAVASSNGKQVWQYINSDTTNSTPASANLTGSGQLVAFTDDQTPNSKVIPAAVSGGHLRVFTATGKEFCNANFGGGPRSPGSFDSSPAIGATKSGVPLIVFGTGASGSNSDTLFAYNTDCQKVWSQKLAGPTVGAPSISVVNGVPVVFEVVANSKVGYLYEFNLTSGSRITAFKVHGTSGTVCANFAQGTSSSVATFYAGKDLQVVIPSSGSRGCGAGEVYSTSKKKVVADLANSCADQNSPVITQDTSTQVGISLACYAATRSGGSAGFLYHYRTTGKISAGSWAEFHQNPQLTGALTSTFKAHDTLVQGQAMSSAYSLTSANGAYKLQVTSTGQLQLSRGGKRVWVLGARSPGARLTVTGTDVRLVGRNGRSTWTSPLSSAGKTALTKSALKQPNSKRGPVGLTLSDSGKLSLTIIAGDEWVGLTTMWSKNA